MSKKKSKSRKSYDHTTNQESVERRLQGKLKRQLHLDGIADDLQKACDEVIDLKIAKNDLKLKMEQACDKVIMEMKKKGQDILRLSHDGEIWEFRVLSSEESLRIAKQTKTSVDRNDDEQLDLPGGTSHE